MDSHPYHNYFFFQIDTAFFDLANAERAEAKASLLQKLSEQNDELIVASYLTLGFKPDTAFMLWVRGKTPESMQGFIRDIFRTSFGRHLSLSHTFFGIVRKSEYSGRTGKPEQVIQNHENRLPYFVLYPFTKTAEWHVLDAEQRKSIMGEHIGVGLSYPAIRQCLLYSYGLDDQEFIVSYEMESLEDFQDLVIKMRRTKGRIYTLADTPTFTCIYKPLAELVGFF